MDNDAEETPAAFLVELGEVLMANEAMDAELATIISQHILTATPAEDSVAQAMKAIIALAEERATPSKENANG